MKQGEKYNYAIIKQNFRTFETAATVDIVKGLSAAERAVEYHDRQLSDEEKDAGWRHFQKRTTDAVRHKLVKRPSSKSGRRAKTGRGKNR
jgi:hypothetical protein